MKVILGLGAFAAILLSGGCADSYSARSASAMPIFRSSDTHPSVLKVLGPVRSYVCVNADNRATAEAVAINDLRRSAEARGAADVIDVQARLQKNGPRNINCPQYVFAKGHAAVLASAD
jgi:hypothetical protein